jgi:type VI secretion system Hcp family effector
MEWAVERDSGPATGVSRRRGAPVIDDLVLTYEYDKSTPKLVEKLLKGEVIPKLEIELTATYGEGGRATYLRYELKNVLVTSYDINASADGGPPTVVIGNNFEEIKVTYTEYDDEGNSKGNVEYEWKVEKGE